MTLDGNELAEFQTEAQDMLDDAEQRLLSLRSNPDFSPHYDAIFRSFHNLKGAAGMIDLGALQSHMHQVETIFGKFKGETRMPEPVVHFFLQSIDATRRIISTGRSVAFDYNLPANQSASSAEAPAPSHDSDASKALPAAAAPNKPGRAMVIDDQAMIVELIAKLLRSRGFEVEEHVSARAALERIHEFAPTLVVSDLLMPEMNGAQLLREIRNLDMHLPVVFVSGALDKEVLLDGLEYGIAGAFEKPFDRERLARCCENVSRRYQLVKLFNKSVNLLLYQFSDLDSFLKSQGKEEIRRFLQIEVTDLLAKRREINVQFRKKAA